MHEMSLAESILQIAQDNLPAGTVLRSVKVRAGPMRGIDPHCMDFAWRAVCARQQLDGVRLSLQLLPWHLRCRACGRAWQSEELPIQCDCGSDRISPSGDDELKVISIEVDDVDLYRSEVNHAGATG